MKRLYGPYGISLSYVIPLDELKTIQLALEHWKEQILADGDYKEDAVMEHELDVTRQLIIEVEAETKRLDRVEAMGGRA